MALKILSYNIQEGGTGRLPAITSVIRRQQPDAVALLEVDEPPTALARDLDMRIAFGEGNSAYHVAWLSRLPIRRSENHRLAALSKTLLEIEVDWEGVPLRLFATHLGSRWDAHQPVEEIPAILDTLHPLAGPTCWSATSTLFVQATLLAHHPQG